MKEFLNANRKGLLAVLLAAVVLVGFRILGVLVYDTNDDAIMAGLSYGYYGLPEGNLVYIHPLLGRLLAGLQRTVPGVSWYLLMELGILFASMAALYSLVLDRGRNIPADLPDQVEEHLKRDNCCGVKLYPGYNRIWLSDDCYQPIYDLAARYDKPVAIHMGLTAFSRAHLKYCHPLALDEVAADHPKTRFVMCHFGNPFLESAAAVVEKNPNVATDLSGLLEGRVDLDEYFRVQAGYAGLLRTWLTAICQWDDVMYGTDWPIVNLGEYIRFIQGIVPEVYWEKVFFHNANRIYGLGL